MSSTDGQTSNTSKFIYGGVTTVLVVGTALICYYRGKKTGKDNEMKKHKVPQALNFVMLDDNAAKIRTAMIGSMAIQDNATDHGVSAKARIASINNFNQIFKGETVASSEKLTQYLIDQVKFLEIAYNAKLAEIKANKDDLLKPKLAAELQELQNPVALMVVLPGIGDSMVPYVKLEVTEPAAGRNAAQNALLTNETNLKKANDYNHTLLMKMTLNDLRINQSAAGETIVADKSKFKADWDAEKKTLDALKPYTKEELKKVEDKIESLKKDIKTQNEKDEKVAKEAYEAAKKVVDDAGDKAKDADKANLVTARLAYEKAQATTAGNGSLLTTITEYQDAQTAVTTAKSSFDQKKSAVFDEDGAYKTTADDVIKDNYTIQSQIYVEAIVKDAEAQGKYNADFVSLAEAHLLKNANEAREARADTLRKPLADFKVSANVNESLVTVTVDVPSIKLAYMHKRANELMAYSELDGVSFIDKVKAKSAKDAVIAFDGKGYKIIDSNDLNTEGNKGTNRLYLDSLLVAIEAIAVAENNWSVAGRCEKVRLERTKYTQAADAVSKLASDATAEVKNAKKKAELLAFGDLITAIKSVYMFFYKEANVPAKGDFQIIDDLKASLEAITQLLVDVKNATDSADAGDMAIANQALTNNEKYKFAEYIVYVKSVNLDQG